MKEPNQVAALGLRSGDAQFPSRLPSRGTFIPRCWRSLAGSHSDFGFPFFPVLQLPCFVPAITLTGSIGDTVRVDCINAIGPIDAWVTLDTITLTNTSQLYFDTSGPWIPGRLYRIVPVP